MSKSISAKIIFLALAIVLWTIGYSLAQYGYSIMPKCNGLCPAIATLSWPVVAGRVIQYLAIILLIIDIIYAIVSTALSKKK